MADEINRLVNQIDVEEAPGARQKASRFSSWLKSKFGNPEGYEAKITAKLDRVAFNNTTKSFRELNKHWEQLRKNTHSGFLGGVFKDKRQITDVNKLFGKLEVKAMEAMSKYQEQLKQLQGGVDVDNGGLIAEDTARLEKWSNRLKIVQQAEEKWQAERDKWKPVMDNAISEKDLAALQGQKTKLQKEGEDIGKEIAKSTKKSFSAQMKNQTTSRMIETTTKRFDQTANKAAALKWGQDSFKDTLTDNPGKRWQELLDFVRNREKENKADRERLTQLLDTYTQQADKATQDIAKTKLDIKNGAGEQAETLLQSLKADLEGAKDNIAQVNGELEALKLNENITKKFRSSLNSARQTKGKTYWGWHDGANELNRNTDWNIGMSLSKEDSVFRNLDNAIPDAVIDRLKEKKQIIEDQIKDLNTKIAQGSEDRQKYEEAKSHVDMADEKIRQAEGLTKTINAETEKWKQELQKVQDEIAYIKEQMELINSDSKVNPFSVNLKADALQPINQQTDELNRKWGIMGNIWDKVKAKMNGVQGYMRKINIFSKLWHKVILNIYSQIATLINPLNIFKRAWNDWINRFDNKAWSNTFEVIKYNLTTAIAPLLEKCAMLALKFFAVINVFTKKWAGVDLFDKSAWQLEQMKKNVGQMTASFDELHSSNENPDALNTMFDKGIDTDSLISKDLQTKLEKWADNIGKTFEKIKNIWSKVWNWVKKHPILAAIGTITLAALLKKWGLAGLLAGILKVLGKGILKIGKFLINPSNWKTVGNGIKTIGGKLADFLGKGMYTGMNSATVTVGKFLGGVALVAGGVAMAAGAAKDAGKNWQDYNAKQKAVRVAGVALGAGMAGLGAVMLGASGPVGWAVAGAVALGTLCIGMAQTQNGIGSLKDETKKLAEVQERLQDAMQITQEKLSTYNNALSKVKNLEEQTGKSGEQLANDIAAGKLKVEDLTNAERELYYAYIDSRKALGEYQTAQKEEFKIKQEEVNQTAKTLAAKGKESGSYDELAEHIKTCWENGTMDTETARDLMSRAMADMSDTQRKTFVEEMPAALQEGLNPEKYASGFQKFGSWIADRFTDWVDNWKTVLGFNTNEMEQYKGTVDDLISAEEKLQQTMDNKNKIQEELTALEQQAGLTADELREKIKNGEIAYNGLTDAQKTLLQKDTELQSAQVQVDKALESTSDHVAGLAYEAYKTSGDYKTFITTLMQQNEQGNISTERMNKAFGEVMSDMNSNEQEMFKQYMKDMGLGTSQAENFCNESQTIFQRWHSKVASFLSDIGQRFKNLFSGNGFKTDIQVNANTTITGDGVAHMAVGTNYVPNDGLAYLHQGEAVIPARYNNPYRPDNSNLEGSIAQLTRQVENISNLVGKGIPVKGEFRQRGSDLIATVERANNKRSNNVLNNKAYAR